MYQNEYSLTIYMQAAGYILIWLYQLQYTAQLARTCRLKNKFVYSCLYEQKYLSIDKNIANLSALIVPSCFTRLPISLRLAMLYNWIVSSEEPDAMNLPPLATVRTDAR